MARILPDDPCCQRAELAGYAGAAPFEEDASGRVIVGARHPAIARKLLVLARERFGWRPQVQAEKGPARRIVRLVLPREDGAGWKRLAEASILYAEEPAEEETGGGRLEGTEAGWQPEAVASMAPCCRAAFVRGAFLASGYVVDPQKGYHLEWVLPSAEAAAAVQGALAAEDIAAKTMQRKGGWVVYIKEADAIAEMLTLVGAHHTLFQFEDVRLMKGVRNQVNRLVNAETANVDKAVAAALKQGEAIRILQRRVGLANLPAKLRAVAEARLAFPYVSLKELGERMDPPLSKSALGHRMRRLLELAEQAAAGKEAGEETEGGEGKRENGRRRGQESGPDRDGAGRNWAAAEEFRRRRSSRRDETASPR